MATNAATWHAKHLHRPSHYRDGSSFVMAVYGCSWILPIIFIILNITLAESTVPVPIEAYDKEYETTRNTIVQLLHIIRRQRSFESLVIYKTNEIDAGQRCPFEDIPRVLEFPVVIVNDETSYDFKSTFANEIVILSCAKTDEEEAEFSRKVFNLQVLWRLENVRRVLYIAEHGKTLAKVQLFCKNGFLYDIYNSLVIFADFGATYTYYSCRKFPPTEATYQENILNVGTIIYENQFLDMHGEAIVTFPDQFPPRTILFFDQYGSPQLDGYVGKLITTYAHKRFATLRYIDPRAPTEPIRVGPALIFEVLLNATNNGSLDIAASLSPIATVKNMNELSYPFELSSYCLMIPLPVDIPINEIFTSIVSSHMLLVIFGMSVTYAALLTYSLHRSCKQMNLVNILLNDKSILGLLGQSFTLTSKPNINFKVICFLIFYTSLMINTMYQAYLQSFLTHPPTERTVRQYADIEAAGLKILIPSMYRVNEYSEKEREYGHIFESNYDINNIIKMRDNFNTAYIYPVSRTRWQAFHEQQKLFERKLFFYSTDICLNRLLVLCVPIRQNLPYRDLFEDHILRIHESGLMDFWLSFTFFDMVKHGLTSLEDMSRPVKYGGPIRLDDFYWIWWLYLSAIAVCLVAFTWELVKWRIEMMRLQKQNKTPSTTHHSTRV